MKDFMPWLAICIGWGGGLGGAIYLAMNHHPVFAVVVLIFGMSASFKRSSGDDEDEAGPSDRTAERGSGSTSAPLGGSGRDKS